MPPSTVPNPARDASEVSGALRWRGVGPSRGGRSVAVAGDPSDPLVFYFGACAGGVWKTTDGGLYWRNVSDGFFGSPSVGAIAVSASDPAVIWVGTGESCVRNNVVQGDGVYRSTDGGATWTNVGLPESRHISRVRVHPRSSGTAYAAVLGDIFGPSQERGVYRTIDSGRSWERVLWVDEHTGAGDLYLDPSDPSVLYAAMWEAVRRPWEMVSGGSGSGLYCSTDGGDSWERISDGPGFASSLKGRIGVAASPARPERVWALVEAGEGEGGLFRSEDRGGTWEKLGADERIVGRPWYYTHIVADPSDGDVLYSMNVGFYRSQDGGRTFLRLQTPHGDNHDLWIDPNDSRRMIEGNDGGAAVSSNGGYTFGNVYNQATAQIYRMDISRKFPFDLYGTQQDNSGVRVPSRSWKGAIRWWDCRDTGFAESGDVAIDPVQPRYIYQGSGGYGYAGALLRFDEVTEQLVQVGVWPEAFKGTDPGQLEHRFGWTFPIVFSPHDAGTLYVAGNRLFRSTDGARSWVAVSPDLSTNDPDKLGPSGGPITSETSGAEIFCTIHAFAESALTPGELWVGTDDGLVQVSRDGGEQWEDVTPPDLPELATVQRVEPSCHRPGSAYLAAHRYRLQDRAPYLFHTEDHGKTWRRIVTGIGGEDFARTICQDPVVPGVLYAGTEHGVYVSRDEGDSWRRLGKGLPVVPVYDMAVRDHELVAATHGRGFWILDDLAPVREYDPARADELVVHTPPLVYRYPTPTTFDLEGEGVWIGGTHDCPLGGAAFEPQRQPDGTVRNVLLEGGENPPDGLAIRYRVPKELASQQPVITVTDQDGHEVAVLGGTARAGRPHVPLGPAGHGLNAAVWDLRTRAALPVPGKDETTDRETTEPETTDEETSAEGEDAYDENAGGVLGPRVPPGTYRVEVALGEATSSVAVTVVADPRSPCTDAELALQYDYLCQVRDALDEVSTLVRRVRELADRLQRGRGHGATDESASPALDKALATLRESGERLVGRSDGGPDAPALHDKLKLLSSSAQSGDAPPTQGAEDVLASLRIHLASVARELVEIERGDDPALTA